MLFPVQIQKYWILTDQFIYDLCKVKALFADSI